MTKRILAMAGVILLVGLYIAALVFAIIGSGYFKNMFIAAVAATIAVPVIIHLFMMMNNVKEGRSVGDETYSYRDKEK